MLSRGSSELTPYLIEVYKNGGSLGVYKSIYKEFEKKNLLPNTNSFALDEQPVNNPLPWDFIDFAKPRKLLEEEYKSIF